MSIEQKYGRPRITFFYADRTVTKYDPKKEMPEAENLKHRMENIR